MPAFLEPPYPLPADVLNLAPENFHPVMQLAGRLIVPAHFDRPAPAAPFCWQRNKLRLGKAFFIINDFCMIESFADISAGWRMIDDLEYILALVADT